jgi:hypothetical protein
MRYSGCALREDPDPPADGRRDRRMVGGRDVTQDCERDRREIV